MAENCMRSLLLQTLALVATLHSVGATSVVYSPYAKQSGTKIQPPESVTLEAKAVWYKCGLKTWDSSKYRVVSRPTTQDFAVYVVPKADVRKVVYKTDGRKAYPKSAKALCTRQTICDKSVDPVYFNYYERCVVVASESTTTELGFTIFLDSKLEVKVFILWGGVGLVALVIVLVVLNCIWNCLCGCTKKKKNYDY